MRHCPICSVAYDQHVPCAVCDVAIRTRVGDVTPAHWRLCDFCREQPENAEWSQDDRFGVSRDVVAAVEQRGNAPHMIYELASASRPRGRPRNVEMHQRVVQLLIVRQKRVRVPRRRDARGRRAGYRWRLEFMSKREIARVVGTSHTSVNRIYAIHFS